MAPPWSSYSQDWSSPKALFKLSVKQIIGEPHQFADTTEYVRNAVASNQHGVSSKGGLWAPNLEVIGELVDSHPFGGSMDEFPVQIVAVFSLHHDQVTTASWQHPLRDNQFGHVVAAVLHHETLFGPEPIRLGTY